MEGVGGDRRSAAAARFVPSVASAGGPEVAPDQVSYPRQRVAGADATVLGDTGRTAGDVGDGRLQPAGVGYGRRTPALAAWGISVVLSGTDRFGQRGLGEEFHPDFLGTGPAAMGHPGPAHGAMALLEHAGPLPRADLECRRAGALA